MERLLADEAHADDVRRRVARFAADTSWSVVGARRLALFDALLRGRARLEAVAAR
jgi:hypothetical protein